MSVADRALVCGSAEPPLRVCAWLAVDDRDGGDGETEEACEVPAHTTRERVFSFAHTQIGRLIRNGKKWKINTPKENRMLFGILILVLYE